MGPARLTHYFSPVKTRLLDLILKRAALCCAPFIASGSTAQQLLWEHSTTEAQATVEVDMDLGAHEDVYVLGRASNLANTYLGRYAMADGTALFEHSFFGIPEETRLTALPTGGVILFADSLRRFSEEGELLWSISLDSLGQQPGDRDLHVGPDGHIYLAYRLAYDDPWVNHRIRVAKVDTSGNIIWRQWLTGTPLERQRPYAVHCAPSGLVVVGGAEGSDSYPHDIVFGVSPAGAQLWSFTDPDGCGRYIRTVTTAPNGDVLALGRQAAHRLDSMGNLRWSRNICPLDDKFTAIAADSSGITTLFSEVITSWRMENIGLTGQSQLIAAVDTMYYGSAIYHGGQVVVTRQGGHESWVRGIDPATGEEQWEVPLCHHELLYSGDWPLAVDAHGRVATVGQLDSPGNERFYIGVVCTKPLPYCVEAQLPAPIGTQADAALADLMGTGLKSLVMTNNTSSELHVFLFNGSQFSPSQIIPAPYTGDIVRAADLDMDGDQDIVVAGNSEPVVMIYLNDGGFLSHATDITLAAEPRSLEVGQLDGVNGPDLAVSYETLSEVEILLHTSGTLYAPAPPLSVLNIARIHLQDMTDDGILDLLTGENANGTGLYPGDGSGGFGPRVLAYDGPNSNITTADMDHDQLPDLVLWGSTTYVLKSNGDGTFGPPVSTSPSGLADLIPLPFEGDTLLRFFYAGSNGDVGLMTYDGCLTTITNKVLIDELNNRIFAEDINGDTLPDLVAMRRNSSTGTARAWLSCSDGIPLQLDQSLDPGPSPLLAAFDSGSGRLTVQTPDGTGEVLALDANGRCVARSRAGGGVHFDASAWPTGCYVIQHIGRSSTATRKVMLVR